jgi:hypothetical protein
MWWAWLKLPFQWDWVILSGAVRLQTFKGIIHLELSVQEEEEQRRVLQLTQQCVSILFKQGMFCCIACRNVQSVEFLDVNSQSNNQPCCKSCWPVVSWCMKRGIVMKKVLDACKDGSIYTLLMAEMKNLKQMSLQGQQQDANTSQTLNAGCRQCALCQRIENLNQFKSIGPSMLSDSKWERPDVKILLESFCVSCRFDLSAISWLQLTVVALHAPELTCI